MTSRKKHRKRKKKETKKESKNTKMGRGCLWFSLFFFHSALSSEGKAAERFNVMGSKRTNKDPSVSAAIIKYRRRNRKFAKWHAPRQKYTADCLRFWLDEFVWIIILVKFVPRSSQINIEAVKVVALRQANPWRPARGSCMANWGVMNGRWEARPTFPKYCN